MWTIFVLFLLHSTTSFLKNMGIIPSKKKKNKKSQNGTIKRPTIEVSEEANRCK